MKQGKRRKLLTPKALATIEAQVAIGVPLQRALNNHNISISRTAASNLLDMYRDITQTPEISKSLFPPWIDKEGPAVQEQPDNYHYEGYFPLGEWVNEDDSSVH